MRFKCCINGTELSNQKMPQQEVLMPPFVFFEASSIRLKSESNLQQRRHGILENLSPDARTQTQD